MFMPTLCLVVPPADRAQFAALASTGRTPQKLAIRARILLILANHVRPSQVASRLAISRNHVHYWVRRYIAQGVGGVVRDASRPGRKRRLRTGGRHRERGPHHDAAGTHALEHAQHGASAGGQ